MNWTRTRTRAAALLAATGFLCPHAFGLLSLNDGRDKIFVTGSLSAGWTSNVQGSRDGSGDFLLTGGVAAEYTRKAGILAIDARAGFDVLRFKDQVDFNSLNPDLRLEVTKGAGRTAGALEMYARRENVSDSTLNKRTLSWNSGARLNLTYPVIERYSVAGYLAYQMQDYDQKEDLVDIETASAGASLFYVLNSQRDIYGGYQYRRDITTGRSQYADHDFHVGSKGKLLPKLQGNARLGYQIREGIRGSDEQYDSWSTLLSATWSVNKRSSLTLQLSKDFDTSASDQAMDEESLTLRGTYTLNSRWTAGAEIGVGHTEFLGPNAQGREDTYLTCGADINYSLNEHFKASLGYKFLENWSTLSFADYTSHTLTLTLSSRW